MHRVILNAPKGSEVDHINGDGLDNRRANLRFVTRSQNCRNQRRTKAGKIPLKGVSWNESLGKWTAQIAIAGRKKHIGVFKDPVAAGLAYDAFAIEHYGSYAGLNFPNSARDHAITSLPAEFLTRAST